MGRARAGRTDGHRWSTRRRSGRRRRGASGARWARRPGCGWARRGRRRRGWARRGRWHVAEGLQRHRDGPAHLHRVPLRRRMRAHRPNRLLYHRELLAGRMPGSAAELSDRQHGPEMQRDAGLRRGWNLRDRRIGLPAMSPQRVPVSDAALHPGPPTAAPRRRAVSRTVGPASPSSAPKAMPAAPMIDAPSAIRPPTCTAASRRLATTGGHAPRTPGARRPARPSTTAARPCRARATAIATAASASTERAGAISDTARPRRHSRRRRVMIDDA